MSHVLAFEPFRYLPHYSSSVADNAAYKQVEVHATALGPPSSKTTKLFVPGGLDGGSAGADICMEDNCAGAADIVVGVETLDDAVDKISASNEDRSFSRVRFIAADVNTMDVEMFKGMSRVISTRSLDFMVVEVDDLSSTPRIRMLNYFLDHGYILICLNHSIMGLEAAPSCRGVTFRTSYHVFGTVWQEDTPRRPIKFEPLHVRQRPAQELPEHVRSEE